MDRACDRAEVRNFVRPRGVNRDARGNSWPPGSVSTSIEVGRKIHGHKFSAGSCARTAEDLRRVPFGGGTNRLRPRIDHAHRLAQVPRSNGEKRLQRKIELGTEAATDGRR